MTTKVHPITSAKMLAQFNYTFAYWVTIAKISRFQPFYANPDLGLSLLVAYRLQPISQWLFAACGLIAEYFKHKNSVA